MVSIPKIKLPTLIGIVVALKKLALTIQPIAKAIITKESAHFLKTVNIANIATANVQGTAERLQHHFA